MTVLSVPLGIVFLAPVVATGAVWAGVSGLAGHWCLWPAPTRRSDRSRVASPKPPPPESYDGPVVERILEDRLSSRLAEQDLDLVDSRVEYLPPGVDWAAHLDWRRDHVDGMDEVSDRLDLPEPDAPASEAKYSQGTSTLFVIGRADDAGERLVVLTALARSG